MADTIQSSDLQNPNKPQSGSQVSGTGQSAPVDQNQIQPVQSSVDSANSPTENQKDQQQTVQPDAQHQGSGFTNIQRILGANQYNQLGQAVGGGIQQTSQQTQQDIGQAGQQFQQQAQAANLNTAANQAAIQQIISGAGSGGVAPTQDQINQFQQFRSGQYAGPQNLQNIGQLQNEAQQAQALGESAGSLGGRIALLQRFAADPNQGYTQGQGMLDEAILGATGAGQLAQARQSTVGLGQQVNQAQAQAQAQAQELQAQAAGLKQSTEQQIQGAEDPINQALTQAAAGADAATKAKVVALQQAFQSGQISADQLQQAGLGALAGQSTYGVDLSQFVRQGGMTANTANIATAEQAARLNALGALGGQGQLLDQGQAGTYQAQAVQGLLPQAQQAIAANKAALQSGTQAAQSQIQSDIDRLSSLAGGYNPQLIQAYNAASPEVQKILREGSEALQPALTNAPNADIVQKYSSLGLNRDQQLALAKIMSEGSKRDVFTGLAGNYAANQAALQQLQQQYGGYTLPTIPTPTGSNS